MNAPRTHHWLPRRPFASVGTLGGTPAGVANAQSPIAVHQRAGVVIATGLYLALAITGWLATTLLTTAGLFIALFFAAGNLTLAGFFEQVALLSTRYGEVAPPNRSEFDANLMIIFAVASVATAFFRRAALMRIIKTGGVDGPASNARA